MKMSIGQGGELGGQNESFSEEQPALSIVLQSYCGTCLATVDFSEIMLAMEEYRYYGNKPAQLVEPSKAAPERTYMM